MIQKITDWWQRRKAKKLATNLANEIESNSEKIDCGNFYIIPRRYPFLDVSSSHPTWLVAYPKRQDHLEKVIALHLRYGLEYSPSDYYPGGLGTLDLTDPRRGSGGIRFIQGSYRLNDEKISKRDEKVSFDRKEFRKLYSKWRSALLGHALEDLRQKGANQVIMSFTGRDGAYKNTQSDLTGICKKRGYNVKHDRLYSQVMF